MEQAMDRLTAGGREFILVGTAHVSRESVSEVRRIITEEKPDRVCVELDEGRYTSMVQGSSWRDLNIGKVLREGKGFLLLANLVLASFQRKLGSDLGVKPGEEMLEAVKAADELGIPRFLCDRNIQITLRRAWSRTGLWGKSKMLSAMLSAVLTDEKLDAAEIEKLKQKDVLATMMEELADYLPFAKQVLIDERDQYLAGRIFQSGGNRIVVVVGAGHVPGIRAHIEALTRGEESPDLAALDELPRKTVASKILPWIIPAVLVGIFALGFLKSGWQMSLELALKWLLANGGLAALGALAALAHPLTIVVAFVGAPIATLNPFIGIGMFTGVAEAFLRKPRVQDFERLQDDVASIKGFYKNRVTRILLVFFLSSIGGMIGNFVAIPWITALLSGGK
jgi:pheromone shutdown-related protein TraB